MIALALSALLTAVDPCAPVAPDLVSDVATADVYLAVARAEEAAGDRDSAAAAYRQALRRAPSATGAREALARLCRGAEARRSFDAGLAALDARDWARAAEELSKARSAGAGVGPSAALLEGIARFELGDDARAGEALSEAARDARTRDSARLYQGLLALRSGAPGQAVDAFEDAATSRALGPVAMQLARQARYAGKLLLVAWGDAGQDSNPALAQEPLADRTAGAGLTLLVRPLGRFGPYLRASGQVRHYQDLDALDYDGVDAAAGIQLGRDAAGTLVEYDLAVRTFGGEPYLTAHRALASGWFATRRVLWTLTGLARLEEYATAWDPLDGLLVRGDLRAGLPVSRRVYAGASYGVAHDGTTTAALSWLEHGPRVDVQVLLSHRLVLVAEGGAAWRRADGYDEVLGTTREDTTLDGSVALELDLRHGIVVRAGIAGRRARSNVSQFTYDTWTPTLGFRYVFGR